MGKNMIRTKADACSEKREYNLERFPVVGQHFSLPLVIRVLIPRST